MKERVLLIIPAYNEEKNIESVVDNLIENYPQYDYLVINDCSTDCTKEILENNNYNYISLLTNLGIGGGVQSGYIYAVERDYDITVQIDGDGQHDPEYIESLLKPILNKEADIAIGSRFIEKKGFQTTGLRRFGINVMRTIIKLCCGVNITDATSGFRASNRAATEFFSRNYANDYPEPEAIVASVLNGFRIVEVPVVMKERAGGKSSINAKRSLYYMIKVSLALLICRISNNKKRREI